MMHRLAERLFQKQLPSEEGGAPAYDEQGNAIVKEGGEVNKDLKTRPSNPVARILAEKRVDTPIPSHKVVEAHQHESIVRPIDSVPRGEIEQPVAQRPYEKVGKVKGFVEAYPAGIDRHEAVSIASGRCGERAPAKEKSVPDSATSDAGSLDVRAQLSLERLADLQAMDSGFPDIGTSQAPKYISPSNEEILERASELGVDDAFKAQMDKKEKKEVKEEKESKKIEEKKEKKEVKEEKEGSGIVPRSEGVSAMSNEAAVPPAAE